MAVLVSKVKGGELTFTAKSGATAGTPKDFSCQYTSVAITPGDSGSGSSDLEYVLCGDVVPAAASGGEGFGDTLDITVVSDHNVAAGLVAFSWAHRGEIVAFSFTPNKTPDEAGGASQTWTGTVQMKPLAVGGEVNGDLRITGSLPITSLTPPTGFGTGYSPSKSFSAPGTVFPADTNVTASDVANAGKLQALGYTAVPGTPWTIGQKITIGTFEFHWDGAKWAPGAAV